MPLIEKTAPGSASVTKNVAFYRRRLLALRARLRGITTQMADNALEANGTRMPNHMAELGSGNFDQSLTLSLLSSERDVLAQIETAIERIDHGTYGQCDTCGETIPIARLQAIPYAAQCIACASERETGNFSPGRPR